MKDWKIGEHARRSDGTIAALLKVERIDEPMECFGLWTESRDYFAEGLLTGETAANQRLLKDATPEKAADMLASVPPEVLADYMRREGFIHEETDDLN